MGFIDVSILANLPRELVEENLLMVVTDPTRKLQQLHGIYDTGFFGNLHKFSQYDVFPWIEISLQNFTNDDFQKIWNKELEGGDAREFGGCLLLPTTISVISYERYLMQLLQRLQKNQLPVLLMMGPYSSSADQTLQITMNCIKKSQVNLTGIVYQGEVFAQTLRPSWHRLWSLLQIIGESCQLIFSAKHWQKQPLFLHYCKQALSLGCTGIAVQGRHHLLSLSSCMQRQQSFCEQGGDTEVMQQIRQQLAACDQDILRSLHKRFQLVKKLGRQKRHEQCPFDHNRYNEVASLWQQLASKSQLNPHLVESLYDLIHCYSVDAQLLDCLDQDC